MATSDLNGDQSIALDVDPQCVQFLRDYFESVRAGLAEDLSRQGGQLTDPAGDAASIALLDHWLQTLDDRQIVGTRAELRSRLLDCLIEVDVANDYATAIANHEAFAHLLRQLP